MRGWRDVSAALAVGCLLALAAAAFAWALGVMADAVAGALS